MANGSPVTTEEVEEIATGLMIRDTYKLQGSEQVEPDFHHTDPCESEGSSGVTGAGLVANDCLWFCLHSKAYGGEQYRMITPKISDTAG